MTWRHGTITGYEHCNGGGRLACDDCRQARARRAAEISLRKLYNRLSATDRLEPTITLQALHGMNLAGHSTVAIAKLTGLTDQQVGRLLNHGQAFVTRAVRDQVLAGWQWLLRHPDWTVSPRYVDSARSLQQIHSLQALGWPLGHICTLAEVALSTPTSIKTGRIERAAANRIQKVYDQHSGTRGPSRCAATTAKKNGWHVPLAYDDDGRLISDALPNDLTRAAERREDRRLCEQRVLDLTALQHSAKEIAEQLGVSTRYVTRARSRRTA